MKKVLIASGIAAAVVAAAVVVAKVVSKKADETDSEYEEDLESVEIAQDIIDSEENDYDLFEDNDTDEGEDEEDADEEYVSSFGNPELLEKGAEMEEMTDAQFADYKASAIINLTTLGAPIVEVLDIKKNYGYNPNFIIDYLMNKLTLIYNVASSDNLEDLRNQMNDWQEQTVAEMVWDLTSPKDEEYGVYKTALPYNLNHLLLSMIRRTHYRNGEDYYLPLLNFFRYYDKDVLLKEFEAINKDEECGEIPFVEIGFLNQFIQIVREKIAQGEFENWLNDNTMHMTDEQFIEYDEDDYEEKEED